MGHFLLTESDTGIPKTEVIAVILVWIVEIVFSFNIISPAFFKQVSICQMTDISCYRIGSNGVFPMQSLSGVSGVCDVVRVGEGSNGGTQKVQSGRQHIFPSDFLPLYDVLEIDL